MSYRRLILVTGAPRTATTPVGNMLARCEGAVSLYEPLGKTGLSSIAMPFPMLGEGLGLDSREELRGLIEDLAAFRFGGLKSQVRRGPETLFTKIFGSRTLYSFRLARLQPWSRVVIWKDPHAIMLAPDAVEAGVDVVVTVRTPQAHAASYRRLGWHSKAAEVYPRWSARFGRCAICEQYLDRSGENVVSAALLWRMSYLPLLRTETLESVHLITSEDLEADEKTAYLNLIRGLGLTPTPGIERALSKPRRDATAVDMTRKAHDWSRSIASLNNYWKDVLTGPELDVVDRITSDLVRRFFKGSTLLPNENTGRKNARAAQSR